MSAFCSPAYARFCAPCVSHGRCQQCYLCSAGGAADIEEHRQPRYTATAPAASTTLTLKMGAGTGWPTQGSVFACKAYIRTSKYSIKGNGRKLDDFERLVHKTFEKLMHDAGLYDPESTDESKSELRSQVAVISRFKKVRKLSLVFEGLIRRVKACKPTGGPTEEDIVNAATAIYNKKATIPEIYYYFKKPDIERKSPGRRFARVVHCTL